MTDDEFQAFLAAACDELQHKQDVLQAQYGISAFPRWWYEQATNKLQFLDEANCSQLEADVIHVGSYSSSSNTWKWAWANESVLPWLRQPAVTLRELEAITGYDLFGQELAFQIQDESMAWELAAVAVKHLGAVGCYRAPSSTGGPTTFLAITGVNAASGNAP